MIEYSSEPKYLGANVKVELDLSNYATKADSKNAKGVDTSEVFWISCFFRFFYSFSVFSK